MKESTSASPTQAARTQTRRLLVRLAMLLLLALSLAVLWWSLFVRLAPVNRQYQRKTRELATLADQVDETKARWSPAQAQQLAGEFQAAQKLLFTGPGAVVDWGQAVPQEIASRGLEAVFQWGAHQAYPDAALHLTLTPATFRLQPASSYAGTNSVYRRLLGFTRTLEQSDKRVDLLDLSVRGNVNSIQEADLLVQLWSR